MIEGCPILPAEVCHVKTPRLFRVLSGVWRRFL